MYVCARANVYRVVYVWPFYTIIRSEEAIGKNDVSYRMKSIHPR